jgi:hypothetical protein
MRAAFDIYAMFNCERISAASGAPSFNAAVSEP